MIKKLQLNLMNKRLYQNKLKIKNNKQLNQLKKRKLIKKLLKLKLHLKLQKKSTLYNMMVNNTFISRKNLTRKNSNSPHNPMYWLRQNLIWQKQKESKICWLKRKNKKPKLPLKKNKKKKKLRKSKMKCLLKKRLKKKDNKE